MQDPNEWFDVLDRQGRATGVRKRRHEVHRDGNWHAAVHVWIFLADGSLLLQQRSKSKDLAPGKLDVSVGGHLSAGETWIDALREVEEEIGVDLSVDRVALLGAHASERVYEHTIDREHQTVIAARLDLQLTDLRMMADEVARLYAAPWPAVLNLWRQRVAIWAHGIDASGEMKREYLTSQDLIQEAYPEVLHELDLLETWRATHSS